VKVRTPTALNFEKSWVSCLFSRVELEHLDQAMPIVTSKAKINNRDPRATLLFRRLSVLLGFF